MIEGDFEQLKCCNAFLADTRYSETELPAVLFGDAFQEVKGYETAPANYEVERSELKSYGRSSTVIIMLCNDLQKKWTETFRAMERILWQLDAYGKSLEHQLW